MDLCKPDLESPVGTMLSWLRLGLNCFPYCKILGPAVVLTKPRRSNLSPEILPATSDRMGEI